MKDDSKYMEDNLKNLIGRAKRGDIEAFGMLYEMNIDSIYKYVFAKVGNKYDAEDVTSQTFLKLIDNIDKFSWRKDIPFKAWFIKIAHNLCMDHFRKKARERGVDDYGYSESFETDTINTVMFKDALSGVGRLDEKHRSVVLLRFLAGLSCREVAAFMKTTEGNVRTMQYRALKMLREKL